MVVFGSYIIVLINMHSNQLRCYFSIESYRVIYMYVGSFMDQNTVRGFLIVEGSTVAYECLKPFNLSFG